MELEGIATKIERPERTEPLAYALFAHCFTCTKDSLAAARISRALTRHGFAVLRFDFTGLGGSDGDFSDTNFSSNVDDILAVVEYMRTHLAAPKLLIGHSLGGAAILNAAGHVPEAQAIVTLGAPSDPEHLSRIIKGKEDTLEKTGEAQVDLGGRPFVIKKQFIDDLRQQDVLMRLGELGKALLILHSPVDETVSIDNARKIYEAAMHPKSFISLAGANHLLTNPTDADYVADVISAWASRYVELDTVEPPPKGEDGVVIIQESQRGKLEQDIVNGPHYMVSDEPANVGGNNAGPTPYGLLLASLGACTSMTLRMYANLKKLPLDRVTVTLRHDKVHAKDCEECETQTGKIDRIERELTLEGSLNDEQRKMLMTIADKCPVHKTLHSEVSMKTILK